MLDRKSRELDISVFTPNTDDPTATLSLKVRGSVVVLAGRSLDSETGIVPEGSCSVGHI